MLMHVWMVLPVLLPVVLLAGALIGATGVGGVLLVPALTGVGGIALPTAIAASSMAFALPALVALRPMRQQPQLARSTWPLLLGGLVGAGLGAQALRWLPGTALLLGVAALLLWAGVRGLRPSAQQRPPAAPLPTGALLALGLCIGVGSALSGTGGPVLLLPVLMLLRQRLDFAVVAAQAIQLPIALSSSAVHAAAGRLDGGLALACGAVLLVGSLLGQRLAQHLPRAQLQRLVSALLVVVGGWMLLQWLQTP